MTPSSHPGVEKVEFFFSYRSPYSYLAAPRAFELEERYSIALDVRGVIPMVMRGQSVPREKGLHTLRDAKREAEALGMPFGPMFDPVGEGAMRCLAVGELAKDEGRQREFVLRAGSAIWSQAIEVASDEGLKAVVESAGLEWPAAQSAIADEGLRARVEANVAALEAREHWGVPTFVFQDELFWGQDRIVDLEVRLREAGLEVSR